MTNQSIDQDGVITAVELIKTPTVCVWFKKQKQPQSVRIASDHNKRARFFYEQGHEKSPEGGGSLRAKMKNSGALIRLKKWQI